MTLTDLVGMTSYELNHERASNCKILSIKPRRNFQRFSFVVRGFEAWSKSKGHIVTVLYPELKKKDLKSGSELTPMNAESLVFCTCPAFVYWGSKYWSTQDGYNIKVHVEKRPPYKRDPNKKRYICKHVIRASRYMRKKGFSYLDKRFKMRKPSLDEASMDEDIKPAIHDYMKLAGYQDDEIQDTILGIDEDTLEDSLEHLRIYLKPGEKTNKVSCLDNLIYEGLFI
jgi:hypothetical protein